MVKKLKQELKKAIVAQDELIDSLVAALFVDGHILVEGLPGVAKTTAIKHLSSMLDFKFSRIQFTPDLLPSDIIGGEIYSMQKDEFYIKKGPIFADLILADEINRAPAKVQSALLEAMQERQVSIGDKSYDLKEPFLVMATMNPIEEEGVYDLPKAQLDRFLMKVIVNYPLEKEAEKAILNVFNKKFSFPKFSSSQFFNTKRQIGKITVNPETIDYIAELIIAFRKDEEIEVGPSPRASIALYKLAKFTAYENSRNFAMPSDVLKYIKPVLRHRITLDIESEKTEDEVIDKIIKKVKA
ncbi:AAA family ATPase [Caminibacter pacificus]|uniref:AAA family ATPase n=1 Tax=Caminibacter pacificus TaxID=1424653 RepID=A0AAJ4UYD7_9BACT|nr:MoxR family ATPase [Caminibacter pacificus]QCI28454.1 AAA family ATPase [Caminibacter pacificus]ROR40821.1 MoxR-like ATPase [Caminibacter pacificus]